jgi:hypothetical protein
MLSRYSSVMCSSAFFPPRLYPVLNRGERDKDTMVTPQVPTGGPIGQTIFDPQADGGVHHAKSVMGVGQGQIQHIGVEIVSTGSTVMLRVGYIQLSRPPGHRVAQIVEQPMGCSKPMRPLSAPGTGASSVVPGPPDDLGWGKILDTPDALGGIGHIVSRAIHDPISKKQSSRKYRPPPVPNMRKSSVMMLQSLNSRQFPVSDSVGDLDPGGLWCMLYVSQ